MLILAKLNSGTLLAKRLGRLVASGGSAFWFSEYMLFQSIQSLNHFIVAQSESVGIEPACKWPGFIRDFYSTAFVFCVGFCVDECGFVLGVTQPLRN